MNIKRNRIGMFLRSPQIMQKKKQTCLTELLLEMNRIGLSLRQACQYAEGGEEPLNKTVNGNETWVHHYHHESKCHFNAMETSFIILRQNIQDYAVSWKSYAYRTLGISRSAVNQFPKERWQWMLSHTVKFWWNFRMQLEEAWLEEYCFIMTTYD